MYQFYQIIRIRLHALFQGYQSLASGLLKRNENTNLDKAAKTISFLGENIPLPLAQTLATGLASFLNDRADTKASCMADKVVELALNYAELDNLIEEVARRLTNCYEEQLNYVTEKGAATLGNCAVRYVMEYIAKVEPKELAEDTVIKMVQSVTKGKLSSRITDKGKKRKIETDPKSAKKDWNYEGVFQRCGIKVSSAEKESGFVFYSNEKSKIISKKDKCRVDKYGYRLGTLEEVSALSDFCEMPVPQTQGKEKSLLIFSSASQSKPAKEESKVDATKRDKIDEDSYTVVFHEEEDPVRFLCDT